jgi:hypothetical protein
MTITLSGDQTTNSTALNSDNNGSNLVRGVANKKFTFKKSSSQTTKTTTQKFKFKKKGANDFKRFTELCIEHKLNYFQFYDTNKWTGPAIKVLEDDFDAIVALFENKLPNKTLILNGYGFVIMRPIHKMNEDTVDYTNTEYSELKFTESPIIPYSSDTDDDSDDEISVEEEFVAEEWVYNQITYLLDTKTNYLYSPSTFEFIGKKTSDFSIDFNAKEL